jgi:hypothetical protein
MIKLLNVVDGVVNGGGGGIGFLEGHYKGFLMGANGKHKGFEAGETVVAGPAKGGAMEQKGGALGAVNGNDGNTDVGVYIPVGEAGKETEKGGIGENTN